MKRVLGSINHFIVSILMVLNIVLAITIVLAAAVAGWNKADIVGLLAGVIVGVGAAAVVCGFLAIFISIEQSLKRIADTRVHT